MQEMNLRDAFAKVRSGDNEAFTQIYNELKFPVYTIALRIVQSQETAEDITHDIFVKLFVSPPDSSVKNPRAWVFRMVHNLSIDFLRKKQCSHIDEISLDAPDEYNQLIAQIDIENAISKLSSLEREVLSLHITGDLRFGEIAKIVNLSLPATYRKYKKALKDVQTFLNGGAQ